MTQSSQPNNFSGLTMNINQAFLPSVPCLLPQPRQTEELSSFVGQETVDTATVTHEVYSEATSLHPGLPVDSTLPPLQKAIQSDSPGNAMRTGLRSRYVLPPNVLTTSRNTTANLVPPTAPGHVPSEGDELQSSINIEPYQSQCVTSTGLLHGSVEDSLCVTPTDLSSTAASSFGTPAYKPAEAYWFYATTVDGCKIWWPFSRHDSYAVETEAFRLLLPSPVSEDLLAVGATRDVLVPIEGGRYDVDLTRRERRAVYWDEPPTEIRRSTWFYRLPDESRVLPFSESTCEQLEAQYKVALESGRWGQPFELPSEDPRGGNDRFIFHNPQSMVQYRAWPHTYGSPSAETNARGIQSTDGYPNRLDSHTSLSEHDSRVVHVRRGLDDQLLNQLDEGEDRPIDHVFFVIHGIGTIYNLRGQGLVECVNNLRRTARQIERSHFPHHNNRVEFLPIMWHDGLHSAATGVDEQLNQISLRSIPKLRQFTNGTLMDILFYTSSKYCQVIVNTVASEMCRLRKLFLSRNPEFTGGFSVVGHSLGSVIAFDLLAHQGTQLRDPFQDDDPSVTTGCGVEEVDFGDIFPVRTECAQTADERLEEVLVADRSGRSSSFGAANDFEGWSMVGYHDSQRQVASETVRQVDSSENLSAAAVPVTETLVAPESEHGDEARVTPCIGRETAQRQPSSMSTEATKLAGLLSRIGLSDDQIHKAIKAWLHDGSSMSDLDSLTVDKSKTRHKLNDQNKQSSCYRSFWVENHHAPMSAGFGMPVVSYPQLGFPVTSLFMLGSPLPLFLTARGIKQLSSDYRLPHCGMFFNVFHPFDPVAYRMETLLDPTFQPRAVLVPHHKGGKRLHLRLKDNLARVGSDLKSKLFQSMQSTWRTLHEFALSHRFRAPTNDTGGNGQGDELDDSQRLFSQMDVPIGECEDAASCDSDSEMNFNSQLNQGRRIDYVLQEAPLESFSDYIFALGSHAAYWESEDTALFLLTEAYTAQDVVPLIPGQKVQLSTASSMAPPPSVTTSMTLPSLSTIAAPIPPAIPITPASNSALSSPLDEISFHSSHSSLPSQPTTTASATNVFAQVPVVPPAVNSSHSSMIADASVPTPHSISASGPANLPAPHLSESVPPPPPPPPHPPVSVPSTAARASQTTTVPPFQAYRHTRARGPVLPPPGIPLPPLFLPCTVSCAPDSQTPMTASFAYSAGSYAAPPVPTMAQSATSSGGLTTASSTLPTQRLSTPLSQHQGFIRPTVPFPAVPLPNRGIVPLSHVAPIPPPPPPFFQSFATTPHTQRMFPPNLFPPPPATS